MASVTDRSGFSGWERISAERVIFHVSPSTSPETSFSPVPETAETTAIPRFPETGSALKATPAQRGAIMRWTSTVGAEGADRPRSRQ